MQVVFPCPQCRRSSVQQDVATGALVVCSHCDWSRIVEEEVHDGQPAACVACGCPDLWQQKDFPARLGLALVVVGAVFSTFAWNSYRPLWAIGILMGFALFDLLLFLIMQDVLVCYRCGARHRHTRRDASLPRFDLEMAERYRQEAARLEEAVKPQADHG